MTTRMPTSALWLLGSVAFAGRVANAATWGGTDFDPVWRALRAFLAGRSPYMDLAVRPDSSQFFAYPPSALLLLAPFGLAPFTGARLAFLAVDAAAILLAAAMCLTLAGIPWRSRSGAVTLLGLSFFLPVIQTLNLANVNGLVLATEAGGLLAAARGRWGLTAVLFGAGIALKPVTLPLVGVLVLHCRWAATAVAVALPTLVSAAAIATVVDGADYVERVLRVQASGRLPGLASENITLAGAAAALGVPPGVADLARLAAAGVLGAVAWRESRAPGDRGASLAVTAGALMLGAFLAGPFAWTHYALYLLPWLATVVRPGSALRGPFALVGAYCVGGPDARLWLLAGATGDMLLHLRSTAGLLLLATAALLHRRPRGPG